MALQAQGGLLEGWQVSEPHPTPVCLPVSLGLSHICWVWAQGEVGRRSRAGGSMEGKGGDSDGEDAGRKRR